MYNSSDVFFTSQVKILPLKVNSMETKYIACVYGNQMEESKYREVHSEATLPFFPLIFLARNGLGSRWAAIRAETRARAA